MPVFVFGDLLLGLPGPAHLLLVFFSVFCFAPAVVFTVRRRVRLGAARREEVVRLAAFAAEESDRAEREAVYEYYAVSATGAAAVAAAPKHQCAVCFRATTTRCARCKTVRYCSGKCQIIHWRRGHKDDCHPLSTNLHAFESSKRLAPPYDEERGEEGGIVRAVDGSHDSLLEKSSRKSNSSRSAPAVSHVVHTRPSVDLREKDVSTSRPESVLNEKNDEACARTSAISPEAYELSPPELSCDSKQPRIPEIARGSSYVMSPVINSSIPKKKKLISSGSDGHIDLGAVKSEECQNARLSASSDSSNSQVTIMKNANLESDSHLKFSFNLSGPILSTAGYASNDLPKENANEEISAHGINFDNISQTEAQDSRLFGSGRSPSLSKDREVEKGYKLKETSSSSCDASDGLRYCSVARHSLSSDASLNLSRAPLGSNSSSQPPMSTLIANNTLKASMIKAVEQFKSPRLSKSLHSMPLVHETAFKSGFKNLFSYDHFSKLYQEKVDLFPCGLINCGNSCFANAILQCLTFTRPLTAYFLRGLHTKACTKNDWCFTCEFERLVWKVKQGKSPISPVEILSRINLGHGKEEDAHEFLRYAIEAMQSVCLMEIGNSATSPIMENTTLIQLIFGGYLKSKIKCMKCQGKSETTERMLDLTVEIQGDIGTIEDALRRFTSTETLDGDNKYRCGRCHSYERARKRLTIAEAPNILTIALKRFQSGKFGKLNKSVSFPEILNLAPYMSASSDKSPVYSLYAVVVHLDVMNAAFSGHYVSYVRSGLGKWYKTDDSVVKPVELDKVLSKGAYLLLYARCSPRAPSLRKNLLDHGSNGKISNGFQAVPANNEDKSRFTHGSIHSDVEDHHWMDLGLPTHSDRMPSAIDSASDNSSLFSCSDEGSCSTDSTRDSTSNDDISDYIFGDLGRNGSNIPVSVGDESEGCSISPVYSRRSPLSVSSRGYCEGDFTSDADSLKRNASTGKENQHSFSHRSRNLINSSSFSSNSDWEKHVGMSNPCEMKSNVTLRRPRERTQSYY